RRSSDLLEDVESLAEHRDRLDRHFFGLPAEPPPSGFSAFFFGAAFSPPAFASPPFFSPAASGRSPFGAPSGLPPFAALAAFASFAPPSASAAAAFAFAAGFCGGGGRFFGGGIATLPPAATIFARAGAETLTAASSLSALVSSPQPRILMRSALLRTSPRSIAAFRST